MKKIIFMVLIILTLILFMPIYTEDKEYIIQKNDILINRTMKIVSMIENEQMSEPIKVYTNTRVNMRNDSSINGDIIKTFNINTELQKVGEKDGWSKIKYDENIYFIKSDYLSLEKTKVKNTSREYKDRTKSEGNLLGYFKLTAYCGCSKCCGKYGGKTACGAVPKEGVTIAADPNISFGTKLLINGHVYTVQDRGGAIKGNKIDIYFNSHEDCMNFGVKKNVPIYKISE